MVPALRPACLAKALGPRYLGVIGFPFCRFLLTQVRIVCY
nr:MAG TPA: hypothetical protein [Caudoviricetes sp.]